MAKISMKSDVRKSMNGTRKAMQKSKVSKDNDSGAYEEATNLYTYMDTVQDAIAQLDLYVRRLHNKIVDGEPTAQASSNVIDWVNASISALEGLKLKAEMVSKSKTIKSDNKFQEILALMQDMTTEEREEITSLIEVRGCQNARDVFGIFDIMADKEYKSEKSMKSKTMKSPADILKSKGWVRKEEDKGPDSEDVEEEAIGSDKAVKVPDTKEPTDNVEDMDTGIPEDDALEEEGEKNDKMGDKEGDDMDALEEEGGTNNDTPSDMDEIDALIEKKRRQNGFYNNTPAPSVGSSQPYANNYRTVNMGDGKMDVMSQITPTQAKATKSTKGFVGSRKRN